jgi:hypothetical protein
MLTGVLCLQGNDDMNRIVLVRKKASIEQLQWLIDNDSTTFTGRHLKRMKSREHISQSIFEEYPEDTQLILFWNPLIIGSNPLANHALGL